MTVPALALEDLCKRFGRIRAVEHLSLEVPPGQMAGFLGPNGAGKSTTLYMIPRLVRPGGGRIRIFGVDLQRDFKQALRSVGVMVEAPAFYEYLSGRRNLQLAARLLDGVGPRDLDEIFERIGLADRQHDKVRTYSQGMKQRLGFARLLLGRPELLVLDEPTNGLDPGEIREIRALIRRLTDRGATVLLSSHHLAEVEQVCSHVVVMNKGRLVSSGRVDDLIGSAGSVYVEVDDTDRARAVIAGIPNVSNVNTQGNGLVLDVDGGRRSDVASALVGAGLRLETIMPTQRLEDAFLDLLDDESSEAPR
jgi:ABC-2 type transport system ATP-binding protein